MLLLTCIYIVSVCLTGSANSLVAGFITIGLLLLLNCDLLHLLKGKSLKDILRNEKEDKEDNKTMFIYRSGFH